MGTSRFDENKFCRVVQLVNDLKRPREFAVKNQNRRIKIGFRLILPSDITRK